MREPLLSAYVGYWIGAHVAGGGAATAVARSASGRSVTSTESANTPPSVAPNSPTKSSRSFWSLAAPMSANGA